VNFYMFNVSFNRNYLRALAGASLSVLLAACGGGGSSGDPAANGGEALQPTYSQSINAGTTASATTPSASNAAAPFGQNAAAYTLAFAEEFNNGLDSKVWNDHIWYETSSATKNYTVEGGALKIWPQRDASGKFFNRTIDTDGHYYQTYGYFEIEAKLPVGKGTWPAFWLFNHIGARRPEIDIMEAYAGGGPSSGWGDANLNPVAYGATIWKDASVQAGFKMVRTPNLSTGFHKYALKWEPNKQTFYFDGKEVYSANVSMSDPMYLMLDLWYGSASGQPDATTPTGKGNSYEVNYIRAWKLK
jgi:beta-glucanase (GH16 family)